MRVPRPWLLLALLSLHWARPGGAGQCHPGELLRHLWGGDTKCCRSRCTWNGGSPKPCEGVDDHDCRCPEGSACADETCHRCLRLPQCEPGWERHRIGVTDFLFECRRCRNGTYSSSRNSRCRNWIDCKSIGLVTLQAGNSTHNSVCGSPGRALEPAGPALEWGSRTVLAALVSAAVFALLLLTLGLHLCLCRLRGEQRARPGDLGSNFPARLFQGEESRSIQFPEEEHGDKTTEEKLSVLSLKVYSELR